MPTGRRTVLAAYHAALCEPGCPSRCLTGFEAIKLERCTSFAATSPAGRPASLAGRRAESGEPVDLPAGSYTGGVTDLTTAGADKAAADIPAVAFT